MTNSKSENIVTVEDLKPVYLEFRERKFAPEDFTERLSSRLLIYPFEAWSHSKWRILIVGQETYGWSFSKEGSYYEWNYPEMKSFLDFLDHRESIDALIYAYKIFNFASSQPNNYRSPFWRAYRAIRSSLENNIDQSVLWANLFHMDVNGGSFRQETDANELKIYLELNKKVLTNEIKALKPNVVLFFTGPNYDFAIHQEFQDAKFLQVKNYSKRAISRIESVDLPKITLRSYHPAYLSRSGQWNNIEQIVELVKSNENWE